MLTYRSTFRTPEGQARYLAAYDATLARWPVRVESFDVPTRFGTTHINACGPETAPPLLLLHGLAISSTMWYPNVADLSRSCRLFALDTIGDKGKSVCTRSLLSRSDFVDWLIDVLSELRLDQTDVAGMSYGGFLALNFELSAPDRVSRLVLLAPAASLLRFAPQFWMRMMAVTLLPDRLLPLAVKRWLYVLPKGNGAPAVQQFLVRTDFRGDYNVFPPVYSDDELRQIRAPTLLLLGDREVIYDPRAALKRALDLIPNIEAEIIPGAGHPLTLEQPEIVNARILAFLARATG